MRYRNPILAQRMVDFILSQGKVTPHRLQVQITRIRRYQSQYDIDSSNYLFWKSVGDKLLRLKLHMEIANSPNQMNLDI